MCWQGLHCCRPRASGDDSGESLRHRVGGQLLGCAVAPSRGRPSPLRFDTPTALVMAGARLILARLEPDRSPLMPSLLRRAAACLCVAALAVPAHAQDWPAKPVKIVVPFAAGGSSDQLARLLAGGPGGTLKQQVFFQNPPGRPRAAWSPQRPPA